MKYKIEAIKEIRYIDTFYVEANSIEEARNIVYKNHDSPDNSEDYDCTFWEITNINEL